MKVVDFILRFWRDRPVFGSCQLSDLDSDGSGSVPPLAYSRCQGTPRVDREIDQTKGSKFCFVGPSVSDLILLSWKGEGRYFPNITTVVKFDIPSHGRVRLWRRQRRPYPFRMNPQSRNMKKTSIGKGSKVTVRDYVGRIQVLEQWWMGGNGLGCGWSTR